MKKPVVKGPIDGNAYAVLGAVVRALRTARYTQAEIDAYVTEATRGDYHHLLAVSMAHVEFDL